MASFSSVSTQWNPLDPTDAHTVTALRTMTLALMSSRYVLMIQYFVVMLFARVKKQAMLPLALHCLTMAMAGSLYLGVGLHISPRLWFERGWFADIDEGL